MLIQTDKFGTSVAQSLRVYSETLRTKRRQRAEEAAAKTGVKMVFPLVFCIFPAIWVVTIGPAAIRFITVLFPMIENTKMTRALIAREHEHRHGRRRPRRVAATRADARGRTARRAAASSPAKRCGSCRAAASTPGACGFAIDVVALDERGVVIDCVSNLKPWRIRLPRRGTAGVLELPAGTLAASGTDARPPDPLRASAEAGGARMSRRRWHDERDVATVDAPARGPARHRRRRRRRIAETGLHPDTLAQLLLKTLVAGESSGTPARREPAPAVLGARRADPARARREARRGPRRRAAPAPPATATR